MRFARPRPRPPREATVPMINVVFLLLIFFLISAQLSVPDPFDLTLPQAEGATPAADDGILYLAADGALAFGAQRGDAVWPALAALPDGAALTLRADAGVAGADLARLLRRLAEAGLRDVALVVTP